MASKHKSKNQAWPTHLSERLAALSPEQLRLLIDRLIDQKPELGDWFTVMIDSLAASSPAASPTVGPQKTAVDVKAFRRQIGRAIERLDYRRHWQTVDDMVEGLEAAHRQAVAFSEGGDFRTALMLMRILGDSVIPQYEQLEEECQVADFLSLWSDDLAEAILGADLSREEREELGGQVDEWGEVLVSYGLDDTLDKPLAACTQDWDQPADGEGVDLLDAKLNVLARRGDNDEYLRLCLERQAHCHYASHLIVMGRAEDAIQYTLDHPMTAEEHLSVAQALQEKGYIEEGYQVGVKGLSGDGNKYLLGDWLAGLAEDLGRLDVARQALLAAFDAMPRLETYQELKRLAGNEWAKLRPGLLARMEQVPYSSLLVEALIDDEEVDEAIKVWDQKPYGGYRVLGKLVDVAAATQPDWAAEHALNEAESLIKKGSKYYPYAVSWLGKVKAIYLRHNRPEDWQTRLAKIRADYGRRYSLMGQIEQELG